MTERSSLKRLASDSAIYSAAGVTGQILTILLVPIFTRALSPSDLGAVGLVNATLAVVSLFAILGLDSAAGRWFWDTEDAEDRKRTISTWFLVYLTTALLLGGAMFAAADWLGERTVPEGGAELYRLAALTIPLGVVSVVVSHVLRMRRKPWAAAAYALVIAVTWLSSAVLFVVGLDHEVPGVYQARISAGVVSTVVGLFIIRSWIRVRWFEAGRLRKMMRFALPLVPAAVAFWIVNLSDRYFLKAFTDNAQVGAYQVSNAIGSAVGLLTVGFQQAWGPFAFSIHKEQGARDVYARALPTYLLGTCIVAAAVSVAAPEIVRVVATPSYARAADAVPWLAFSYVMLGANYIAMLGANLTRTTKPVAASVGWAALANTILNLILIPRFGGVGAGIATLTGWLVMVSYVFFRSHKLYPIPYRFGTGATLFGAALFIGVLGERWQPDNLAVAVAGKAGLVLLLVPLALALGISIPRIGRWPFRSSAGS